MTAATLTGPVRSLPRGARRPARAADVSSPARELTLDQMLTGVWSELSSHAIAACPVCSGAMLPRYGGSGVAGGRCSECATTIG